VGASQEAIDQAQILVDLLPGKMDAVDDALDKG
jgi:hypothetical protein